MRRTTATTIVDQARLLHSLLISSPESSLVYHYGDLERYFRLLAHDCQITHSVSPRFPDKNPSAFSGLFDVPHFIVHESSGIRNMAHVRLILEDIVQRKIKIVPRPD